jgi:hypothetical protein
MSARPVVEARPSLRGASVDRLPIIALLLSVAALGAGGVAILVGLIEHREPRPAMPSLKGPFGVGQRIPTTFGAVSVDLIEKLSRPNRVRASVTLSNFLNTGVGYAPTQFSLLVGRDGKPAAARTGLRPGTLAPDASIRGRLEFTVPRTGARLWLRFTDPQLAKPILVDLGTTGRTPASRFPRR